MFYLRAKLFLYTAAIWLLAAGRFLAWILATGGLAMGAGWYGRPVMVTQWLVAGPPARRGHDREPVVVALEAARGFAAMECWMRSGCPPRADHRARHGPGWPGAAS